MHLITDRTQADVLLGNSKGKYGPEDLNRVETAVSQLCDLAQKLDIHPALTVKTDWSLPGTFSAQSWPTQSQMERYLNNVRILCDAMGLPLPLPAAMDSLDWVGANQIEQGLQHAYARVQSILDAYHYSGECYAGKENTL